ncbi:MAG: hypothetical protein NZ744_17265, partial [Pirellulaceae bacterium]|nr:hypothetical protein [Pirellulaceae bacterium]
EPIPNREHASPESAVSWPQDSVVRQLIDQVANRCRWYVRCRAALYSAMLMLACFLGMVTLDWIIQHRLSQIAWLQFACLLAMLILVCRRWAVPAWKFELNDFQAARRIEQSHAELGQRLSVLCDLRNSLQQGERRLEFMAVMESQLEVELVKFQIGECFRVRVLRRPLLLTFLLLLTLFSFAIGFQSTFALASQRTLSPWTFKHWPRRHELTVVDHREKVSMGADYQIKIGSQNWLFPREVFVDVRWDGDAEYSTLKVNSNSNVHELVLPKVQQSFVYRIHGGDYEADQWRDVTIVSPPVVMLSKVIIYPPVYTELESYESDAAARVLHGSQLQFQATIDRPLQQATLLFLGEAEEKRILLTQQSLANSIVLSLSEPMTILSSGTLDLELIDEDGVVSRNLVDIDLNVVEDHEPIVNILSPHAETLLTAAGRLPLVMVATDDLQITQAWLQYCVAEQWDDDKIQMLEIPIASFKVGARNEYTSLRAFVQQLPDRLRVEMGIDVGRLGEVASGTTLQLRVQVADRFGNNINSDVVPLTVLSLVQFRGKIRQELQLVAKQLADLKKLLQLSAMQTRSLRDRLVETTDPTVLLEARDLSSGLLLQHRSTASLLDSGPQSILGRLLLIGKSFEGETLLPTLVQAFEQFNQIATELDQQLLPQVQSKIRELTLLSKVDAIDVGQLSTDTNRLNMVRHTDDIVLLLEAAIAKLEILMQEQVHSQRVAEFADFWTEMMIVQKELLTRTRALQFSGQADPSETRVQVMAQARTESAELQGDLADRIAQYVFQLSNSDDNFVNQSAAEFQFLRKLQDSSIVGDMRNAARLLLKNDVALAIEQQQRVTIMMQEILSTVATDEIQLGHNQMRAVQLLDSLKTIYKQQLGIAADLQDMGLMHVERQAIAARQDLVTKMIIELLGLEWTPPVVDLSLRSVASHLQNAQQMWFEDTRVCQGHIASALSLLRTIIDAAGTHRDAAADLQQQSDVVRNQTEAVDLVLILAVQEDINMQVRSLINMPEVRAGHVRQLKELEDRQRELSLIVSQIRKSRSQQNDYENKTNDLKPKKGIQ